MKFKQAQKKKCVVFGRFFWVAELEGQERFNYTKYLRHPIHLFALLCFACLLHPWRLCFVFFLFTRFRTNSRTQTQSSWQKYTYLYVQEEWAPKNAPTNSLLSIEYSASSKHLWDLHSRVFLFFERSHFDWPIIKTKPKKIKIKTLGIPQNGETYFYLPIKMRKACSTSKSLRKIPCTIFWGKRMNFWNQLLGQTSTLHQ